MVVSTKRLLVGLSFTSRPYFDLSHTPEITRNIAAKKVQFLTKKTSILKEKIPARKLLIPQQTVTLQNYLYTDKSSMCSHA